MTRQCGITLIELIIALAIIAILSLLAYPSYQQYVLRARRSTAQSSLIHTAAILEAYYMTHQTYLGADVSADENDYYQISVNPEEHVYTLQALPINSQAKDLECGSLFLSSLGERRISGNGDLQRCWGG